MRKRLLRWLAEKTNTPRGQMYPLWWRVLYQALMPMEHFHQTQHRREVLMKDREHVCAYCFRTVYGMQMYGHTACEYENRNVFPVVLPHN